MTVEEECGGDLVHARGHHAMQLAQLLRARVSDSNIDSRFNLIALCGVVAAHTEVWVNNSVRVSG